MHHRLSTLAVQLSLATLLGALPFAAAQTPCPAGARFEVAKPDDPNSVLNFGQNTLKTENSGLPWLLQIAFNLPSRSGDLVAGLPHWATTNTYDINAKEDEASAKQLEALPSQQRDICIGQMLAALLGERFALRTHFETRPVNALVLKIAKGGSRLLPAHPKPAAATGNTPPEDRWEGLSNSNGKAKGRNIPMNTIREFVKNQPESQGRLVVDQTGLTGKFNFNMKWTPEHDEHADNGFTSNDPAFLTALREQLGLTPHPARTPAQVLIVDHIEQPSAN